MPGIYLQFNGLVEFSVYSKHGNAFSYLPNGSYHARHGFRGGPKVEVLRLLTRRYESRNVVDSTTTCEEEVTLQHLFCSTVRKVSWSQRQQVLNPKMRSENEIFFATNRGCVFSTRNTPGSDQLNGTLDHSLKALQEDSEGGQIFPARGFFST
jgi:hypothetical protein